MGDTAWDRKTKRVIEIPGDEATLAIGLARGHYDSFGALRGRYMCRACCQDLILRAIKPDAKQVPHFRHESSRECPASAERQREIALDDQVVIDLRDRLLRAWPGATICLDIPEDLGSQEPGRVPADGMPPAIVVSGSDGTVVIERPRKLPDPEQIGRRLRTVRARYGASARHVWFLAKDPLQFAKCGKLHVAPRGRDRDVHVTVAPTEQQLAIIAASGGVYWLDGQQVLVPYGVHDFTHTLRDDEEDWNFTDWRRGHWHKDWRISHPLPAPDATRWGLVPLSLHQMTGTKASFSMNEARDLMQRLEDVQRARWRRRRADARELYAARHAPRPPVVPPPGDDQSAAKQPAPVVPSTPQVVPPPGPPADNAPRPDAASEQTGAADAVAAGPAIPPSKDPGPTFPAAPAPDQAPAPVIPPPPPHPPYMSPAPAPAEPHERRGGLRGVLRRLLGGQ
ncbi:hypothetical protein IPZ58_27720 [Streptomyces roseoverticillatus]|uniref:hypothetical protein n=1 Tax=Streptomyces roseoverticillatus TaxID=66429 RepID=UPI001F3D68D7|nr:hypothetical protein [Streptomyces roseoverticillatus]MCF3105354.1 hypothetical protein [Streptomyces roseoverticillatus]